MRTTHHACALALVAALAAGCVSKGTYDEALAQTELTKADLGKTRSALDKQSAELAEERVRLAKQRSELAALQAQLDALTRTSADERTQSSQSLDELRRSLDQLRAARAASDARAALFRTIALRLREQVDAGSLQIVTRDGRMVLQLSNDVLFDTGRTELKPAGQAALKAIAAVLKSVPDRQFQVAGHTDDVPIHNAWFASNWELSAGRALRVVHFLKDQGVSPAVLSAAGYADVDPVAPNDTAESRKRNRRTEITLQPNINEIVRVP